MLISVKAFFSFLISKRFIIHFIISLALGSTAIWLFFNYLNRYTQHGEAISVPDFKNIKTEELNAFVSEKKLQYQIIDSIFDPKAEKGVVIKQDPEKDSQVKENRIIYLTISAKQPPLVKMPKLVDVSLRQALAVIESYGLKAGKKEYKPDACVNCVLEQRIKGKPIEPGKMIPKGSIIDLVLGQGENGGQISIPCLIGLTKKDALQKLSENGMSEGTTICTDCKTTTDKTKAKVYKQTPSCSSNDALPGSTIDLYFGIKPPSSYKANDEN